MGIPKTALDKDALGQQTISPRSKNLHRFEPAGVPNVVVTVEDGYPNPQQVWVAPSATVQFVNKDAIDYKVRLWIRSEEDHPDVDVILPARGSVTVIVDPETPSMGQCYYELLPFNVSSLDTVRLGRETVELAADTTAAGDGGDAPPLRKSSNKDRKGPGGGIITVP
jgi:hypothetical protein